MSAENKIQKAKVSLLLQSPFFASIALVLQYIEDNSIETACTNGLYIKYNPEFIESLKHEEVTGLLAHEVMHIALFHHTRRNNRDIEFWNEAADYAINHILKDSGFKLPEGALLNTNFKNKSAEQIYSVIYKQPPPNQKPGAKDKKTGTKNNQQQRQRAAFGEVEDTPDKSQAQITAEEDRIKEMLSNSLARAKKQGKLPATLERLITEALKPRVNWHDVLANFLLERAKNNYTWSKPSPRYLHMGLYLPALENVEYGEIALIVDTSGSVVPPILNRIASEAQQIVTTFACKITVIYVDTKVAHVQQFEPDEPILLKPRGGGGTDFRPGFHYITDNNLEPKAIVYLTDGCSNLFPKEPEIPVLWAVYNNDEFIEPFGDVLKLDQFN